MPRVTKNILKFDDSINDFMIHCSNKDLRPKTMKSYESTIGLFSKYMEEEEKIFSSCSVTTKHIKDYLKFTVDRGKYSYISSLETIYSNNPANRKDFGKQVSMWTVNNYLRNLKVFFTFLYENGAINTNASIPIRQYKHSRRPKNEIKDIDFNKLSKGLDLTKYEEYRDYIIIQLLMDTGMRIGECLNLKTDDVLLDKKAIFIPSEINKGRKDRYVFFSMTIWNYLKRWIDYKDRYFSNNNLFCTTRGSNFSVTNLEKNLKKYCIKSGLENNITCHQIRNNFAKRFLLSGRDIFTLSKILGHSSVTVTENTWAGKL